jgi:hypothetical protein
VILQLDYILGCRAFRTVNNLELYPSALLEGFEAFGLNCGVVNEYVFVKPFYCTFYHFKLLLTVRGSLGTALFNNAGE